MLQFQLQMTGQKFFPLEKNDKIKYVISVASLLMPATLMVYHRHAAAIRSCAWNSCYWVGCLCCRGNGAAAIGVFNRPGIGYVGSAGRRINSG